MSDTEDREFRITWRSVQTMVTGNPGEAVIDKTVTAAYYQHEDGRFVFKRADGQQAFDVASALVETIECLEYAAVAA